VPQEADATNEVRAAGGVVWRRRQDGVLEVLLVHRPRYEDWTFPKGKVKEREREEEAARREVEEETGLRCEVGPELATTRYSDSKLRPKTVRYWAMTPHSGSFEPHEEVDEVRWLPPCEAARRLGYNRDLEVLSSLEEALRA
jgi:8-oxo-dGTP diphosphatase